MHQIGHSIAPESLFDLEVHLGRTHQQDAKQSQVTEQQQTALVRSLK